MAQEINDELEFDNQFDQLKDDQERIKWMAKKVYYLAISKDKHSDLLIKVNERLDAIERNCRAQCDTNELDSSKKGKKLIKGDSRAAYAAYGGVGTVGAGMIIYGLFKIIELLIPKLAGGK